MNNIFSERVDWKNNFWFPNTNAPQGKPAGLPAKLNPVVQRGVKKQKRKNQSSSIT